MHDVSFANMRSASLRTYVLWNNSDSEGRWFESSRAYHEKSPESCEVPGTFCI